MGNPFRLKFPKAPEPAQPGRKGVAPGASPKAQGCGARLKPEIAEENRRRQRFRLCSPAVFSCFTHPHHASGCSAQGTEALGSKTCSGDRTGMQSLSTVVLSLGMTGQRRGAQFLPSKSLPDATSLGSHSSKKCPEIS